MRHLLPWLTCGFAVLVAAYFILRPAPDARSAAGDIAGVLIEHKRMGSAELFNAGVPISNEEAQGLLWDLGSRHFPNCTIVDRRLERKGPGHVGMQLTLRDAQGKARYLALTMLDKEGGGGIDIRRLLECIWDSDAVAVLGRYPTDPGTRATHLARGLESDLALLESHGITTMSGKSGPNEALAAILDDYRASVGAKG